MFIIQHALLGVIVLAISFNHFFFCLQEINSTRMWMYFLSDGGAMWVGMSFTSSHVGGLIWQNLLLFLFVCPLSFHYEDF
jgi:hypothetical protein